MSSIANKSSSARTIILVGCGKMGSALLGGWLKTRPGDTYAAIEPRAIDFKNVQHFKTIADAAALLKTADAVILAIKPQNMDEVSAALKAAINPAALILSIAAGQSLERLASGLPANQPIVRAMPNTPAAIGKGISSAIANAHITPAQKTLAQDLLSAAGPCVWIEDEALMDGVTALSGSGPAYVFHLIEVLAASGEKLGLPAEMAMQLARQTVIGAAALADSEPNTSAETLRKNVTSPGGTTEAALKILMDGQLQKIFDTALAAAKKRGQELNE